MHQSSKPTSPAPSVDHGPNANPHGGEAHADPSIERLRAASLVKSPNKRVNAEPISSGAANPWVSPRAVSPTDRTGVSYAGMASRPATPPALLALKKASALAVTPTQHSAAANGAQATAASCSTQAEVIDVDATMTTTTTVIKEEENLELDALALRRTRSGKQAAAAKLKNKKARSKRNAKAAGKMPATIGKGAPTSSSAANRSASEARKRRRVSEDVDGDNVMTGTTSRIQDAPAVASPAPRVEYRVDIGEVLGFPRLDWSPPPDDNRVDPPATTTSDLEERDFEMYDPVTGYKDGDETLHRDRDEAISARTALDNMHFARRLTTTDPPHGGAYPQDSEALREGNVEDLYASDNEPTYRTARTLPGPSRSWDQGAPRSQSRGIGNIRDEGDSMSRRMREIERASRSSHSVPYRASHLSPAPEQAVRTQALANDVPLGLRRPRSSSSMHPHPVHYAPGPFPDFPADPEPPAPPAPPARNARAGPVGPIAPLAPTPGAPPPLAMTRTPPGGWPRIQGVDFTLVYANVLASQAEEWQKATDYHVYIHFPGRSAHDRGNFGRLCAADTTLRTCLGIPTASITQPIAAVTPTGPNSSPVYYRVGNLTIGQRDRLLREGWVSTRDGTFGVVSSEPSPPTFMGTFRHPLRLGVTTEEGMADAFKKGLRSAAMYLLYLLSVLNGDILAGGRWRHLTAQEAFELIIDSVTVKKILLRNTRDEEEEPFAFLYIESPTSDPAEWLNFRNRVRNFAFGGPLAGPPELVARTFYYVRKDKISAVGAEVAEAAGAVVEVVAAEADEESPATSVASLSGT
ncbi:uncharacterized protein B0H18DRAFT_1115793 [Fomitopsis serialis]|uniref:uncharacterized protein n=1 Tax=Fomitopsis serialis TaxID=139415 RepID=UPI00200826F4|nr:uncharacterized protein B0H18DRAFT_1115793 [Neoantrodia serialis]KAH9932546.1 hypothetical protein B0H18DRAFT_1115793 [Neoantrodia serialis]